MRDIIIFYILVSFCLLINLFFLIKDGRKYSNLFFYYIVVLSIILALGIYLSNKYKKDLDIIEHNDYKLDINLQNNTPKCQEQPDDCNDSNIRNWDNGIIYYDLSNIGDTTITKNKYLDMKLSSFYILLGLLLCIIVIILIYLGKNIYFKHLENKINKLKIKQNKSKMKIKK